VAGNLAENPHHTDTPRLVRQSASAPGAAAPSAPAPAGDPWPATAPCLLNAQCLLNASGSDPGPHRGDGLSRESGPRTALRVAIPQSIAAAILRARTLSPRERAVFDWLGQGYDNRSIAREMNISERTVKRHVTLILAKLRLESRLQAGLAALIISAASPLGED
jgi:DNA-binding CsgD family transcriptional regulator